MLYWSYYLFLITVLPAPCYPQYIQTHSSTTGWHWTKPFHQLTTETILLSEALIEVSAVHRCWLERRILFGCVHLEKLEFLIHLTKLPLFLPLNQKGVTFKFKKKEHQRDKNWLSSSKRPQNWTENIRKQNQNMFRVKHPADSSHVPCVPVLSCTASVLQNIPPVIYLHCLVLLRQLLPVTSTIAVLYIAMSAFLWQMYLYRYLECRVTFGQLGWGTGNRISSWRMLSFVSES